MTHVILYRKYDADYEDGEIEAMGKYFPLTSHRTDIKPNQLVIGRYSVLPFYKEQEEDVNNVGASLINSYKQHCYVANMGNWINDLGDLTPKSWPGIQWIDEPGPYVLKGETNSIRQKWFTHMYATDLKAAQDVYTRLCDETLLLKQSIWIRKFEKLKHFGTQVNGLPIANEFRFFVCDQQVLSGGFYWSSCLEDLDQQPDIATVPLDFIKKVIKKIGSSVRYYALDVAQKADEEWTVIELNDGQMSGLSCNDPDTLYGNLKAVLSGGKSTYSWSAAA